MGSLYKISLIPQDMRHEDTIIQIADTLEYMEKIVDEIFTTVNNRIEENKRRVNNLTKRVEIAQKKIQTLASTKKATVVFSCTKYPASDIHKPYKSCFPLKTVLKPVKSTNYILKNNYKTIKGANDNLSEKLHFFHVKVNENQKSALIHETEMNMEAIPEKVSSVCDILFFNSPKNPYYVQLNPNLHQQRALMKKQEENSWTTMDAPPQSISNRETLMRREEKSYFYSPDLGDVPTIDVPIDLPDLPGVADGLRYNLETGPTIAPSVITSPVLPDLPAVEETETVKQPVHTPPPQVPDVIPQEIVQTHVTEQSSVPEPHPPPPLPPPLPELEPEPEPEPPVSTTKFTDDTKSKPVPVASEMRASLMEAIRAAGGVERAKLKSTNKSTVAEKTETTDKLKKSTGNSLMDDLHAKLSMRRKGISGTKSTGTPGEPGAGNPVNSAFSRLSAMIPPPPKSESNDAGTTDNDEEEDWND